MIFLTIIIYVNTLAETKVGIESAIALRNAQLSLMDHQSTAHPYYWASFSLTGASHAYFENS
ncbi:MAG: CHAT domain-containing protein [Chloroflexi bacterium]|nr:CHAT domain-containing protein [Chloroflexota bacterium]